jgi:putative DNA methylase
VAPEPQRGADLTPRDVTASETPAAESGSLQIDIAFDVTGVSELAHRERSAFKPVYSMNRWWARRSSAVFRAILLGLLDRHRHADASVLYVNALKEFPEAADQVVLDPFMGGGTTIVEALRVGYRTVGVDLNPLAWFIVRNECTAVDLATLDAAFERVRAAAEPNIQALYSTDCPHCSEPAQVVHAFWAKLARCGTCDDEVEMRRDWVVGRRRNHAKVSYREASCGSCKATFDAELQRGSVTFRTGSELMNPARPWTTCSGDDTRCPLCGSVDVTLTAEVRTKKVDLFAVQCPACRVCATERGPIRTKLDCPQCGTRFEPENSNTGRGVFECSRGHRTSISDAARRRTGPLPFVMYAVEGFCSACRDRVDPVAALSGCRFFKTPDEADLALYERAKRIWTRERSKLPWPREPIRDYEKTNRLVVHNYSRWSQLFNDRQLLSLGYILDAVRKEPDQALREALSAAFLGTLEHQNMLNIYYLPYAQSAGAFGRHDFHPKVNACEGNPWGAARGRGTFVLAYQTVRAGKQYLLEPFEPDYRSGKRTRVATGERVSPRLVTTFEDVRQNGSGALLTTGDSRELSFIPDGSVDHVVTDPPYADAVQYSELADFFYVWLREALREDYPELLAPEETPKTEELVQNVSRGHSEDDFHRGLRQIFAECHRVLKDSGRLVFTFHHSRRSQWEQLHRVILGAGFELVASYPVASEGTRSGNLVFHTNRDSIAYDIIHVCRKRLAEPPSVLRWSTGKRQVEKRVRAAVAAILGDVDHGQRIAARDVAAMTWAEVAALYSRHNDQVTHGRGSPRLTLAAALDDVAGVIERTCDYAVSIADERSSEPATSRR